MTAGTIALIVVGILFVVVLGWAIGVYNRFVSLRQHIKDAWAGIDVELKRRYNLIPAMIETAKGYMNHERETLEAVIAARNTAAANDGSVESQAKDESLLQGAMRQFFALAENYPELKADTQFTKVQTELSNTEDRIAAARRFYNGNVRTFNTLAEQIPSSIIAGMFNFSKADFFEVTDEAVREMPKVSFS